ncbi:MAG: TonB-dependent receptor [Novosphingobium sp.]
MKSTRFAALRGSTAIRCAALLAALAASNTALAQDVGTEAATPEEEAQPAPDDTTRIIVTGSHLQRDEFSSPDPLQVISPALAAKRGISDAAGMLQGNPLASGSSQVTSTISANFPSNGGIGVETLALRGLGANRTLVLLNGRRAGPAGTRGTVSAFDLNVLPLSVIDNVEVLKTGASSIYGSDAIAGVVNIKTRDKLDGIDMRGFTSVPQQGGGETYNVSGAWGKVFGGGHFTVAGDYWHQNALKAGDRKYLNCQEEYLFRPDGKTRADLVDPRNGKPICQGTLNNVIALGDMMPLFRIPSNLVAANGSPIPFIQMGDRLGEFLPPLTSGPGQFSAPAGFYGANYDGVSTALLNKNSRYDQDVSIIPETKRYTAYFSGAYEVTPNVELFAEGLYNRRENHVDGVRQIVVQQFTGRTMLPFVLGLSPVPGQGDPLNQEFSGEVLLQPIIATGRADFDTKVDYYRGVAGGRGDFGENGFLSTWTWDAYVQYSRSDGTYTSDVLYQDSLSPQNLRTGLCAGTVTAVRGAPCMDLDFTDPRVLRGELTRAEEDFLFGKETGRTTYDQWTAEAFTSGEIFDLPGGAAQFGLGAQYRYDKINDTPGEQTLLGNAANAQKSGVTAGHSDTSELYGELNLPLIANLPFAQAFSLSAAGRVTNVSAIRKSDGMKDEDNGNWTYKLGANWQVNDWLRFRGTYGTSFRSPALFEQFLADETGFQDQLSVDPCIQYGARLSQGVITQRQADNCAADGVPANFSGGIGSAEVTTGGGIGSLKSETSRAWTASVVLSPPPFWSGVRMSLALDYFDIKVKDEITRLGAGNVTTGCYQSKEFPSDPLCGKFSRVNAPGRPTDHQIAFIEDNFINISKQHNTGIDVTAEIIQDLGSMGTLAFQGQMTWQLKDKNELFAGYVVDNNGEVGEPKWVGDFALSWNKQPFALVYSLDAIGATSNKQDLIEDRGSACYNSSFRGGLICPDTKLGATFYHNASLTLDVDPGLEFTLGVSNLTNQLPPRASTVGVNIPSLGQVAARATYYDLIGRRFFTSVRVKY